MFQLELHSRANTLRICKNYWCGFAVNSHSQTAFQKLNVARILKIVNSGSILFDCCCVMRLGRRTCTVQLCEALRCLWLCVCCVQRSTVAVAESTLHGDRAESRSATRRRRQVPRPSQVPSATDDLGRRADIILLQGPSEDYAEGLVHTQRIPVTAWQARIVGSDWPLDDTSQQLVQEQTPERPCRRDQTQVADTFHHNLFSQ